MKKAWLTVRSIVLWAISGIHFAVVCTLSDSARRFSSIRERTIGRSGYFSATFCGSRARDSK